MGGTGGKNKTKEQIIIIFWLEQIFPEIQEVHALGSILHCWKHFVSYMNKRANKGCYLFPAQQLHSSPVALIQLRFGYASACAPVHTYTHKVQCIFYLSYSILFDLEMQAVMTVTCNLLH